MMSNLTKFAENQANSKQKKESELKLVDGSRIGVIGGGPAGSFFSYFTLDMAERLGTNIKVDIFEPRDFFSPSPKGCNMCGGIISETLVQMLATEGITLPPEIIQRGIDSYTLHMDIGSVAIETPLHEKRIGAVHRGCGPRDSKETKWGSFDGYLQILAIEKGANVIQSKVDEILFDNGRPKIICKDSKPVTYDLITVAVGINTPFLKIFPKLDIGYQPPAKTKTFIREFYLGEKVISDFLGSSMHIFLLDIPGLEFAAFIPKGDYVTLCMLGQKMDNNLLDTFLSTPEVKAKMPPTIYNQLISCHCNPFINVKGATNPFADRIVFIGDSGVTRLFKDGQRRTK
jgi:flavin-dependent dehydrogenase